MKLDDLLACKNGNFLYLPYWIKIFYSKKNKLIKISCYVYWFKYEESIKNELEEKLSERIDEPILYNTIEESKNIIEKSLKDKKMLNDLLTEIGKLKAMKEYKTTDNILLFQTNANDDIIEDFEYDEIKFSYPSNTNKNKHKKNENKKLNNKKKEANIDKSSPFQAHSLNNSNYISILNKIKHKPIIIEFIFSYLRNSPLKYLN